MNDRISHDEGGERARNEPGRDGEQGRRLAVAVGTPAQCPPQKPDADQDDQYLAGEFERRPAPGTTERMFEDCVSGKNERDGHADVGRDQQHR